MKYKIHQIKDIENTIYAFRRYNPNCFNYSDYECVYEGEFNSEDRTNYEVCEALFYTLNVHIPKDYRGRSLSMSDVVELKVNGKSIFYYCDFCGFLRLPPQA